MFSFLFFQIIEIIKINFDYFKNNSQFLMSVKTEDFLHYFPFPKIRRCQKKSIKFILNSFIKYDYVILEAGTGVGKSAIAVTVSRYLNNCSKNNESFVSKKKKCDKSKNTNKKTIAKEIQYQNCSYFITTQKILQQQYINDFGNFKCDENNDIEDIQYNMRTISSAANYECKYHCGISCSDALKTLKVVPKNSNFFKNCSKSCIYKKNRQLFMKEIDGVTNFAYFLAQIMYVKKFLPRNLLIIDEAHNCDLELANFINIEISNKFLEDVNLEMPQNNNKNFLFNWISSIYEPKLNKIITLLEKKIEEFDDVFDNSSLLNNDISENMIRLVNKHTQLNKSVCKIRRFIDCYDPENWVLNIIEEERKYKKIQFKTIDISKYSNEMIFKYGKKILMMSATILDKNKFCELNGLEPEKTKYISISSPFSHKNKPIYYCPTGNMSFSHISTTLPKMIKIIKKILKRHSKDKGIIHCHSYKILEFIKTNLINKRFLSHDSKNRDLILKKHITSVKPTVILSPSMKEGVDLKDNISRFQIICKVPYPYLGDKLIKCKMNKWKWWYSYETVKKIIQSLGRSIRNKKDHAKTYILDSCWENFYNKNENLFPKNFNRHFVS